MTAPRCYGVAPIEIKELTAEELARWREWMDASMDAMDTQWRAWFYGDASDDEGEGGR